MGLRLGCIKMDEQSLLLESPLLKILLLENDRSDSMNAIFDERKKEVWRVSYIVPSAAGASIRIF